MARKPDQEAYAIAIGRRNKLKENRIQDGTLVLLHEGGKLLGPFQAKIIKGGKVNLKGINGQKGRVGAFSYARLTVYEEKNPENETAS